MTLLRMKNNLLGRMGTINNITDYGKACSEFINDWRVEINGENVCVCFSLHHYDLIDLDLDFDEEYYQNTIIPNVEEITITHLKNILNQSDNMNKLSLRISYKIMTSVYMVLKTVTLQKINNDHIEVTTSFVERI